MVEFDFKVNRSVLEYPSHPITIPKRHNESLKAEGLADHNPVLVICPDGHPRKGFISTGQTAYGTYYQVRIPNKREDHDCISALHTGVRLRIRISKVANDVRIDIEHTQDKRTAPSNGLPEAH